MPVTECIPGVRLEVPVLIVGARLDLAPVTIEHLLVLLYEVSRMDYGTLIDHV
jgi:hypothetical protein